jgi:hypothetical protein
LCKLILLRDSPPPVDSSWPGWQAHLHERGARPARGAEEQIRVGTQPQAEEALGFLRLNGKESHKAYARIP